MNQTPTPTRECTWKIGDYAQPKDWPEKAGKIVDISWNAEDDTYYIRIEGDEYIRHEDELELGGRGL